MGGFGYFIERVICFFFCFYLPVKRAVEKGWAEVLRKRLFELADVSSKRVPFSPLHCFFQRDFERSGVPFFGYFLWHQRKYLRDNFFGYFLWATKKVSASMCADISSKRVPFSPQHCFFQRAFERSGVPFFGYFLWHQRKYLRNDLFGQQRKYRLPFVVNYLCCSDWILCSSLWFVGKG